MSKKSKELYEFGFFRLDVTEHFLVRISDGERVPLSEKAFKTLYILVRNGGHLLKKDEMLSQVWADSFVEENNLDKCIFAIRRALGEKPGEQKYIETVRKHGYRFVAEVLRIEEEAELFDEKSEIKSALEKLPTQNFPRRVEKTNRQNKGTVIALATWRCETDEIETIEQKISPSTTAEQTTILGLASKESNDKSSQIETQTSNLPKITRRRKGLIRGLKILLWGLGIGFVFLVLLQVLVIFSTLLWQGENALLRGTSNQLANMIGGLLVLLMVPIGLGFFGGIGLFLFGNARIVCAVFEKESSKISPIFIERLIAAIITIIILAVAIPNLLFSYRQANRARQLQPISVSEKKSIAVLPLKPINTANRDEIYEIGIAESLIHRLNSIKGFVVRPLSATRKYTNIEQDPRTAGREYQVDYVLASNYQLAGGKIRITAQLFDVANGQIEETYTSEKDTSDIFAMQDAIADEIGNNLLTRFGVTSSISAEKRGTNKEEAYRLYLQGMYLYDKRTAADSRKAVEVLDQAVRLDPNYALAWAGLAHAHRYAGNWGRAADIHEEYRKSTEAINRALALDANLSEAHSALCENKFYYEYDFDGAERECRRAVELDPNSSIAHEIYSRHLYCRGRFDEAIIEIKTAIALEPTSFFNQLNYGAALFYARRYEEAVTQYKRVIETEKNLGSTAGWLSITLAFQGKEAEAFEWFMKPLTSQKASEETLQVFKTAYQTSGWQGVLREQLKRFDEDTQPYYLAATLNAQIGNKDQAFEYLEKSFNRREVWMAYFQVDPRMDNLRDDPRFNQFVRRVESK